MGIEFSSIQGNPRMNKHELLSFPGLTGESNQIKRHCPPHSVGRIRPLAEIPAFAGMTMLILIVSVLASGCSKEYFLAKYYLIQAEDAYVKAYELRVKPEQAEQRMGEYRKAHDNFLKAYHLNKSIFNLIKIDQAHDTCLRLEDKEGADLFQKFAEEYAKEHPTEAEYGDATPLLGGIE